ncbi:MAG: hypothetical protein M3530_01595 [Thermoproteota archaeon]|nr:hypothetical protein [Thermoproteota archaeon]
MIGLNLVRSRKCSDRSDLEQDLTFEEVCPAWSEKLRKGLDRQDKYILARDSKYCLVGEAWGFTGKQTGYYIAPLIPVVGCWCCIKYGRRFGMVAKDEKCTATDFEPLISEFLAHWNQKHKSVTKGIRHKSELA